MFSWQSLADTASTGSQVQEIVLVGTSTPPTLAEQVASLNQKYQTGVSDELILRIIKCESNNDPQATNYNKNHTVDKGIAQINSSHFEEMHKLGLSENNTKDQLEYMFMLLKRNGLKDYSASKTCWSD